MIELRSARTTLLIAMLVLAFGAMSAASSKAGTGGIGTGSDEGPTTDGTFPVQAPHEYGDGLGAGRGHQGQDLLAKCGKPVVAAQAGRVRFKDYQASGAGNYVVIKGTDTKFDYVYMHLLRGVEVSKGDRVEAGDTLGQVGSTGDSTACHLHFEMWAAPGWYAGGDLVDPKPFLKDWDRSD